MCLQTKKKSIIIAATSVILVAALVIASVCGNKILHRGVGYTPDYEKIDLSYLADKDILTDEDYKTVFYQTGLGRAAVDALLLRADFIEALNKYQEDFFSPDTVICKREAITTCMEYATDAYGNKTKAFQLSPIKAGYVLIMESSHSFYWRHGHAGIALSSSSVLEALMIGTQSGVYSVEEWCYYPNFVMLRLKDSTDAQLYTVAKSAYNNLRSIDYSIFSFKSQKTKTPSKTQCAHLVWQAFINCGIDIDANGDGIVTVQDILYSDAFEVVQIYGYSPDLFVGRIGI